MFLSYFCVKHTSIWALIILIGQLRKYSVLLNIYGVKWKYLTIMNLEYMYLFLILQGNQEK